MAEHPPAASRQAARRLNRHHWGPGYRPAEKGMVASTLGVIALVLLGSMALIAGSLSLQTSSSRNADEEQAREAAEWGFNTLIDQLNQPAYQHLLVTKWVDGNNGNNGNWVSVVDKDRTDCMISATVPVGTADLRSGTQNVGSLTIKYRLIRFEPPQYPGSPPNPDTCPKFLNRAGGTARLTVLGELMKGDVVLSSQTIQRDITVETNPDSAPVSKPFATVGGMGGGSSTYLDITNSALLSFDANVNWIHNTGENTQPVVCLGQTVQACKDGSSSLKSLPVSNAVIEYPLADFLKLYPASVPIPTSLNGVAAASPLGRPDYPYNSSGSDLANSNLAPGCRLGQLPIKSGGTRQVIACRVSGFTMEGRDLIVDTLRNDLPVVLYLSADSYVLKERDNKPSRIINKRFADTRTTNPPSNYQSWTYLRIYSDPSTYPYTIGGGSICQPTQVFKLVKGSTINGAFVWLPRAEISFDNPKDPAYNLNSQYSLFGALWACKIIINEDAVLLSNGSNNILAGGIDDVFSIPKPNRYFARSVERSL